MMRPRTIRPRPPEPGRQNRADGTGAAEAASKMLNLIHTKFDHKVENGDGQSVPKFRGILSQKLWGSFVQGTFCSGDALPWGRFVTKI
jgi:hypothetical protein